MNFWESILLGFSVIGTVIFVIKDAKNTNRFKSLEEQHEDLLRKHYDLVRRHYETAREISSDIRECKDASLAGRDILVNEMLDIRLIITENDAKVRRLQKAFDKYRSKHGKLQPIDADKGTVQ